MFEISRGSMGVGQKHLRAFDNTCPAEDAGLAPMRQLVIKWKFSHAGRAVVLFTSFWCRQTQFSTSASSTKPAANPVARTANPRAKARLSQAKRCTLEHKDGHPPAKKTQKPCVLLLTVARIRRGVYSASKGLRLADSGRASRWKAFSRS